MGKAKGSSIKTVTLTHEYVCSTPTCGYDLGLTKTLRLRWFSRDWDEPVSPHSSMSHPQIPFIHFNSIQNPISCTTLNITTSIQTKSYFPR